MASRVRVLSERLMQPGRERAVRTVMERAVARVRSQPGFVRGDILRDAHSPAVYCVLTEWESVHHLNKWLANPDYEKLQSELDGCLGKPVAYQILSRHKDDLFLL